MANGLWCGCCNDSVSRLAVKNARITVYRSSDKVLLGLYADKEGTKPLGNPFLTREDGLVKFYCEAGRIDISAMKDNSEHIFENEIVLDDWAELVPSECTCGAFAPTVYDYSVADDFPTAIPVGPGTDPFRRAIMFAVTPEAAGPGSFQISSDEGVSFWQGTTVYNTFSGRTFGIFVRTDDTESETAVPYFEGTPASVESCVTWYVDDLTDNDTCVIESIQVSDSGSELLVEAPTSCTKAFGLWGIWSGDGYGGSGNYNDPEGSGFESGNVGPGTPWRFAYSEDYALSSQNLSFGVASGPIFSGIIAMRTKPEVIAPGTLSFTITPDGPITEFYSFAYGFSTVHSYGSISAGGALNGDEIVEVYLYPSEGGDILQIGITGTTYIGRRMTITIPGYEYGLESGVGEPWGGGGYDDNVATVFIFNLDNGDTLPYCSNNPFTLRVAPLEPWMYGVTVGMNFAGIDDGEYGYAGYGAIKNYLYVAIDDTVMEDSAIAPSADIPPTGTPVASIRGVAFTNDGSDSWFILQMSGSVSQSTIASVWPAGLFIPLQVYDSNYWYDDTNDVSNWEWIVNDAGVFNWDGLSGLVRGLDIVVAP